ncbi:Pseudocholinesterase [Hyphodiscus hymeniophilus]|uniref:Carboxylic ester hydrolase n=1 Tax=Hyphodiscus hymeniophilus TaxID=353542 RepID=A0A9P7AXT5_9HELO|nr:Pseudocholinesterase [Hyphodiscus hymeniophilus]
MISLIIILTTVLVLGSHHKAEAKIDFTVDLGYSKYTGVSAADNETAKWLGIRYAAPPVGNLRFRAPQAPLVNESIQLADTFRESCLPTPSNGQPGSSEDCLFLNVFAPIDDSKKHPVYVYLQGGGFVSNSAPNLDGTSLIAAGDHDMVFVNFNYRVGAWGFLASKEIQANGDLNAGILDQRFALQWVQKYIHLFGGDPTQVTIGGCSAGGASVTLHLSAYGGRNDGLFIRAAAESQSFGTQYTVAEAQYQYDGLVARVGCNTSHDTLQCLRDIDTAVIAQDKANMLTPGGGGGVPVFAYSDVIDGTLIQDYTAVTNDGTVFTPTNINNYTDVDNFLKNNFPKLVTSQLAEINHLYPQAQTFPNSGPYWRTTANAYGDMRYMCPGIWLSTIYDSRNAQGWNYHWDVAPQSNLNSGLGVTHCDQSNSILGIATAQPEAGLNPIIQAYWASFIRSGDPNKFKLKSAPTWTKLDRVGLQRIHFVNNPSQVAVESVPAHYYLRCNYLTDIAGSLGQ